MREGLFREDLLHRLNVIRIEVPPLRNRREDIPELLQHYLDVAAIELGVAPKVLTPDAEAALVGVRLARQRASARQCLPPAHGARGGSRDHARRHSRRPRWRWQYSWRRAATDWVQSLASWAQARFAAGGAPLLEDAMPEFERTLIREALKATHGGRQEAAKLLGWGRNTLTRKLKELGMEEA